MVLVAKSQVSFLWLLTAVKETSDLVFIFPFPPNYDTVLCASLSLSEPILQASRLLN